MRRPETPETRIQIIQAELGMRTEHIPSLRVPMSPGDVEKALAWAHAARLREEGKALIAPVSPPVSPPASPPDGDLVPIWFTREQVEMVLEALHRAKTYHRHQEGDEAKAQICARLAEQIKEQR